MAVPVCPFAAGSMHVNHIEVVQLKLKINSIMAKKIDPKDNDSDMKNRNEGTPGKNPRRIAVEKNRREQLKRDKKTKG